MYPTSVERSGRYAVKLSMLALTPRTVRIIEGWFYETQHEIDALQLLCETLTRWKPDVLVLDVGFHLQMQHDSYVASWADYFTAAPPRSLSINGHNLWTDMLTPAFWRTVTTLNIYNSHTGLQLNPSLR